MNLLYSVVFPALCVVFMLYVLYLVSKGRLNLKYSLLWLGLSIAKELTQRMDGSIGAALHGGTLTVWVEFPRQELDRK